MVVLERLMLCREPIGRRLEHKPDSKSGCLKVEEEIGRGEKEVLICHWPKRPSAVNGELDCAAAARLNSRPRDGELLPICTPTSAFVVQLAAIVAKRPDLAKLK